MSRGFHVKLFEGRRSIGEANFNWGHVLQDPISRRRFRIVGAARQGGNGVVFRAQELDLSDDPIRECAVKVLKQLDPTRLDRFENEVRIHRRLNHPRIAAFHGAGVDKFGGDRDLHWAAMELGGPNLREYQDQFGRIDVPTAIRISIQAAGAIEHLHSQELIHRDIKPANFIWADEEREHVFMIDFGLAKYTGEDVSMRQLDQFTLEGDFVGPQNWMSPELLAYARDKKQPVAQASDVFQLGMLIWYLLTNTVLAGCPSKRLDRTAGEVHSLVTEMYQQDPSDRPRSISVVIERLRAIEAGLVASER